jgi:hypothetical protein
MEDVTPPLKRPKGGVRDKSGLQLNWAGFGSVKSKATAERRRA